MKVTDTDGTVLGTAPVRGGAATATVDLPQGSGQHTLTVVTPQVTDQGSSTVFDASSATTTVTVPSTAAPTPPTTPTPAPTVVSGESSVSLTVPATVRSGDEFLAEVHYTADPVPTGATVIIRQDGVDIASAPVGADGVAQVPLTLTTTGDTGAGNSRHVLQAVVSGQVDESDTATTIIPAATSRDATVVVTTPQTVTPEVQFSAPDTVTPRQDVTLSATVGPDTVAVAPGMTVSFYDGDTLLADAEVDPSSRTATATVPPLRAGTYDLRAVFNGGHTTDATIVSAEASRRITVAFPTPDAPSTPGEGGTTPESGPAAPVTTVSATVAPPTQQALPTEQPGLGAILGSSGDDQGHGASGSSPLPIVIVLGILGLTAAIFTIPDVRRQFNLPPLVPLFPVPR